MMIRSQHCGAQGVIPGGLVSRDPPEFGLRGRGGVVDGFRKKYSVFCTESLLENVLLKEKFAKERLFMRKTEMFWVEEKRLPGKWDIYLENLNFFGSNRTFLGPDSRPFRSQNGLTPLWVTNRGPNLRRQSLESELKFMFLITKLTLNGPHDLWFWEWLKTVVTSFVHYW